MHVAFGEHYQLPTANVVRHKTQKASLELSDFI